MCKMISNFEGIGGDWHFLERRKFFSQQENRRKWLKELGKWNDRLRTVYERCKVSESSTQGPVFKVIQPSTASPAPAAGKLSHSAQLRALSRRLFVAISSYWLCNCPSRHEASFCLANCISMSNDSSLGQLHFDFLISEWEDITSASLLRKPSRYKVKWHEGSVTYSTACGNNGSIARLKDICAAIESVRTQKTVAFQLHIEDDGQTRVLLGPELRSKDLPYYRDSDLQPASISLDQLLTREKKPPLAIRLRLAHIFAHSVFQLHESPWPSNQWNKEHITFFYMENTDKIDYDHPYLNTSFETFSDQKETRDPTLMHKNAGILKLGILLIELYDWKPIETHRQPLDLKNGQCTVNTDTYTAFRMLEKMKASNRVKVPGYIDLIKACLNVGWVHTAGEVSLEDESTRIGFQQAIIAPLKNVVTSLESGKAIKESTSSSISREGGKFKLKRLLGLGMKK
ncbi:hypothetical protein BJ508DRAFT_118033 [Ascobolus immersus RN42]|uniref:DUF7580 domain-containing protein n=1 Tax=Ascobolus immersus RN42 TaxID=1160509 RepID=A0A3N4I4M4_ASCIM|nr:hypothetical protein BJ508DRAFT_118033 [Ascobolus immersus RN42]